MIFLVFFAKTALYFLFFAQCAALSFKNLPYFDKKYRKKFHSIYLFFFTKPPVPRNLEERKYTQKYCLN